MNREVLKQYLEIEPEVARALAEGKAVVALESTIISHGMPYPQNMEMAKRVQAEVRSVGAVPATIAIMNGRIKIGLSEEDLLTMATAKGVAKVSRRDFAALIASGKLGATTVASTMMAAEMAGISFFVTGGIGGVHRGFEETMDVSADLDELAMTNVTVIGAGAKSILDLPRTLEYLETKGVPVVGFGTDVLPAFYTRESDLKLNLRADTAEEVARMIRVKNDLGLKGGVLVANPIPQEFSLDAGYINSVISEALRSAVQAGIKGKDVTPYLLKEITKRTEGKSLAANLELVYNNARIGAAIAVAYSKL